jgi:hypothetical protein
MLGDFHLLDDLTEGSTISGSVLPANSDLLGVVALLLTTSIRQGCNRDHDSRERTIVIKECNKLKTIKYLRDFNQTTLSQKCKIYFLTNKLGLVSLLMNFTSPLLSPTGKKHKMVFGLNFIHIFRATQLPSKINLAEALKTENYDRKNRTDHCFVVLVFLFISQQASSGVLQAIVQKALKVKDAEKSPQEEKSGGEEENCWSRGYDSACGYQRCWYLREFERTS